MIAPTQQSAPVRPPPRFEHPRPPQAPHAATQHARSAWMPGKPFEHVLVGEGVEGEDVVGAGVAAVVGVGVVAMVGAGVAAVVGAGVIDVGAGVDSPSA